MRQAAIVFALLAGVALPSPASLAKDSDTPLQLDHTTGRQRRDYIRKARVWEPTDVAGNDLYGGPPGRLKFAVNEEVSCEFVPKRVSGWSPKFYCKLVDGTIVKVKYEDGGRYKEVFGEVLGTRLFWALGFYADRMLPVQVTCHGCPEHPYAFVGRKKKLPLDHHGRIRSFPPDARLGTYRFELAAIEDPIDSETIEKTHKQGVKWRLIEDTDETKGGAKGAEIDALRLLMAFVQASDNKDVQNKLACPRAALATDAEGGVTCRSPIMFVDDLGSVFGGGGFTTGNAGRVDYAGWKARHVWRDSESCRARLKSIGGCFRTSTLSDPRISEGGRALLSEQLAKLSDGQLADLFRASRIVELHQTLDDGAVKTREVTIDDWVELFKQKRNEITEHPACPPR